MTNFNKSEYITIISERKKVVISVSSILYIVMEGKTAEIHLSDGKIYNTRMTFVALEAMLGDGFIKAHRGCIVSAMAIHEISDMIDLVNGEKLEYARRRKNNIIESLQTSRKRIINALIMTVCRIPKSSITTINAPLMRCRLRLPILRWCSTRSVKR